MHFWMGIWEKGSGRIDSLLFKLFSAFLGKRPAGYHASAVNFSWGSRYGCWSECRVLRVVLISNSDLANVKEKYVSFDISKISSCLGRLHMLEI